LDFCETPNTVKIIIEEKKGKLIKNWQSQHKGIIGKKMPENLEDEQQQEMTKTKIIVQHKLSFFQSKFVKKIKFFI
jgi:hypothetical protein